MYVIIFPFYLIVVGMLLNFFHLPFYFILVRSIMLLIVNITVPFYHFYKWIAQTVLI